MLSTVGAEEFLGELGRLSFRGMGGGGICVDVRREGSVLFWDGTGFDIVLVLSGALGDRGTLFKSGAIRLKVGERGLESFAVGYSGGS